MTQSQALEIMSSGANVFLTGAPGAGKTFVLNQFIKHNQYAKLAVTASTGIAASHINGVTIHSWAGIGIEIKLTNSLMFRIERGRASRNIQNADILIIDEVSMLHDYRLDMVNNVCKAVRGSERPFGGLQVILVGDLFQLPPVSPGKDTFDFVHHSGAWKELDMQICYITEQHRQETADGLLDMLVAMRSRNITPYHHAMLEARKVTAPANVTRLFTHNIDVDHLNNERLALIQGVTHTYDMKTSGDPKRVETMKKSILAPERLNLKVGAEVMFVANNFDAGFVNGTRGVVKEMRDGSVDVETVDGRLVSTGYHAWPHRGVSGLVEAEVRQIPLRLAWAITVHKSQGMSLDAAQIDLRSAFTPGMGYVALSRVRSLDGLYLDGFNDQALLMHEEIHELDKQLRLASARAESMVGVPLHDISVEAETPYKRSNDWSE